MIIERRQRRLRFVTIKEIEEEKKTYKKYILFLGVLIPVQIDL